MAKYVYSLLLVSLLSIQLVAGNAAELIQSGEIKLRAKNFSGAAEDFTQAIFLQEQEVKTILKSQDEYAVMSTYEKAKLEDTDFLNARHDLALPYYGRGLAFLSLEKNTEALADLDIAIRLDDRYVDAYFDRATVKLKLAKNEMACLDIKKAALLGHKKAEAAYKENFCANAALSYYKEANNKYTLHKYEEAIPLFDQALQLNPDSASYYVKRAKCLLETKKVDKAMADYDQAIALSPANKEFYFARALAYISLEKYPKAFEDLTQVIKMDANNFDAYLQRAAVCESTNQTNSAIYDYGQCIRVRPSDGSSYYKRALLYKELNQEKEACLDFKKAAALEIDEAADYAKDCK